MKKYFGFIHRFYYINYGDSLVIVYKFVSINIINNLIYIKP